MKKLLLLFLLCGPVSAQVYNQFECGGDLNGAGCTWNSQVISPAAVTLAKQANLAANSFQANATSSAATPQAINPLAAANLLSAVINVTVVATGNITASGIQTVDGITLANGQSALLAGQTSSVNDGIFIVNSAGAWTRAINFPNGYIIAQNCDILVIPRQGTTFQGHNFKLVTTAGAITIGTSAEPWSNSAQVIPEAQPSTFGTVEVTATNGNTVSSFDGPVTTVNDCVQFADAAGSIGDVFQLPCAFSDANGHFTPIVQTNPTVTGTGCSASGTIWDSSGAVVATGIDTCTITFGGAYTTTPFCVVSGYSATVLPFISTPPNTAAFSVKTAAAGTFSYNCL